MFNDKAIQQKGFKILIYFEFRDDSFFFGSIFLSNGFDDDKDIATGILFARYITFYV